MRLRFTIPIPPKGQERARATIKWGKIRVFKSASQRRDEVQVMRWAAKHAPKTPLEGPVAVGLKAYMPIPASKSKAWKEAARKGAHWPTKKPDLDNVFKNLTDCLTRCGFWRDDAQVVECQAMKLYGDPPRYEVEIVALTTPGPTPRAPAASSASRRP